MSLRKGAPIVTPMLPPDLTYPHGTRYFEEWLTKKYREHAYHGLDFDPSDLAPQLIPFFGNVLALSVLSFIFGLGMGCGQPITTMLIFSRSAEGRSGETLGLRQSVNNVLRVSGPAVFGLVASAFGLPPVFWLSALMMGVGGLLARPKRAGS